MADEYQHRRPWFENYVARCEAGVVAPPNSGVRYPCPCCGYPTLSERGGYEICQLCNWEDDGQDDPHAEEVWGGPNGSYSLVQARANFRQHLVMYDPVQPDTRIGGRDSAVELDAKRQIVAAFEAMRAAHDEASVAELWATVRDREAVLEAEVQRRVREHGLGPSENGASFHRPCSNQCLMTFRRLAGLPPYGAAATTFPPQWGAGAREGLVVEFAASDGNAWVGNFQPGIGGVDEVLSHPNGRDALVVSNGSLWIVNPVTRSADELASAVFDIWRVTDPDGYLLNNQGLGFVRLSPEAVLWKSRRISWDGFSGLRFEGEHLTGQAWSPIEDGWLPFTPDLRTGRAEGGSYTGPEMELGF